MDSFAIVYVMSLISAMIASCIHAQVANETHEFNVVAFGALGDSTTNDSQAFIRTWQATCNATAAMPTKVIPKDKTFLVHPITFAGPCKPAKINIVLSGTILAPNGPQEFETNGPWLQFNGVSGININGNGSIDGRGKGWWDISCKHHPELKDCGKVAPTSLTFRGCQDVDMSNILFSNSPQTHILVEGSHNMDFGFITIQSPGDSPNTDGIHISNADNVTVHDTHIGSGDDCVSIGDHVARINVNNVACGPGHGISIGSLGRDGNEVDVKNITVRHINFTGTKNGVRIKTYQVGRGQARNIEFSNLNFTAVENPIIIDQYYCEKRFACEPTKTGVHISEVVYRDAIGTSKTEVAINFNCSTNVPCTNINLDTIKLAPATSGVELISSCNNAYGSTNGTVQPKSILPKTINLIDENDHVLTN